MKTTIYKLTTGIIMICLFLTFNITLFAQAPQKIDYQAVARASDNSPLIKQNIGVRFTIYQGASQVYQETHNTATDDFGLFALPIGDGNVVSGSFANINWSAGNHSVKTEIDPNGGTSYLNMGTVELTTAPYAFYGKDEDADPTNEVQDLTLAGNTLSLTNDPTAVNLAPFMDNTDAQTLSLAGQNLSITGGNTVVLPSGGSSLWTATGNNIYYNTGKVGIGTASPVSPLHVLTSYSEIARFESSANSNNIAMYKNNVRQGILWNVSNNIKLRADIGSLSFQTAGINTDRMIITAAGNVGIGTTTPTETLEVHGTTKFGASGKVFSEIREFTGTTASSGSSVSVTLPSGYTETNTRVISLEINYLGIRWVGIGRNYGQTSISDRVVSYQTDGNIIYILHPNNANYQGRAFRVMLMKVE